MSEPNRRRKKRNKGSPYERLICRVLTEWWTGDPESDVVFWRTAGSGGRATVRGRRGRKTNSAHCGDIAALDDDAAVLTAFLTFEIKRGYNATAKRATVAELLDKPFREAQEGIESWIEQAERSAVNAGTPYWAIIHQRDKREPYILFPMELYETLEKSVAFRGPLMMYWGRVRQADGSRKRTALVGVGLDYFLDAVTPTLIRFLSDKHRKAKNGRKD